MKKDKLQLSIFKFLNRSNKHKNGEEKAKKRREGMEKKKKELKKSVDLLVSLHKDKLILDGDVGMVKLELLNESCGLGCYWHNDLPLINYVRGESDFFNELKKSSIRFAFSPETEMMLNKLKRSFERKSIPLRVDMEGEDIDRREITL